MKHYAGIDLSMETSHVCVVDAEGGKVGAVSVDSMPEAIAAVLERYGTSRVGWKEPAAELRFRTMCSSADNRGNYRYANPI